MPFPAFVTQFIASGSDTVKHGTGTTETIPATRYYFLISPKTSVGDGQSLLRAISDALHTSSSNNVTYSVTLNSDFKIVILVLTGTQPTGITMSTDLAVSLGFALASTTDPTVSLLFFGGTSVTATWRSPLFWSPEMVISATGPDWFDPALAPGIRSSAGAAQRSPDMTASFVSNGVQTEGDLIFSGVQPHWRVWPQTDFVYVNQDFITWWSMGARIGRRILFWRDRLNLVGTQAPVITVNAPPGKYIEYYPSDRMRAAPLVKAAAPPNLVYWDVTLSFWLTERGETMYYEP